MYIRRKAEVEVGMTKKVVLSVYQPLHSIGHNNTMTAPKCPRTQTAAPKPHVSDM